MSNLEDQTIALTCPIPISQYPHVLLAHGGGGKLMNNLLSQLILPTFNGHETGHDGAVFQFGDTRLAFTTDSYVIHPLFFPGGDIGELAVYGTVNDLAMCGARPLFLSLGLIIEEGLPMETLWQIVQSIQRAATRVNVQIATGDTKVVDRNKGDGLYINTAGIGIVEHDLDIRPQSVRKGDIVILSGDIGRHGMAIMAQREGLAFESEIESDSAPLIQPVLRLLDAGIAVHCLRDLTRGGLSSALIEIAQSADLHIHIEQASIPVREDVEGACELLGFDPMYVANEGRFIAIVKPEDADRALNVLQSDPLCPGATIIGMVTDGRPGTVTMRSVIGVDRVVDMLSGEQLPRIC